MTTITSTATGRLDGPAVPAGSVGFTDDGEPVTWMATATTGTWTLEHPDGPTTITAPTVFAFGYDPATDQVGLVTAVEVTTDTGTGPTTVKDIAQAIVDGTGSRRHRTAVMIAAEIDQLVN